MNFTMFARLGRGGRRLLWGGALTALLLAAGTTAIGDVHPDAKRLADQRRESFSLFAGPTAVLQGNRLQCGLTNDGNGTCTDVFNSPTGGGGFWPTGSPNQYIFNTGVQVAGIHGADGGPWANDTVGAFFFDASGLRPSGTAVSNIFDSLNPDDLDNWPDDAIIEDADIFPDVLLGRKAASQQDSWMQYWDGNPAKLSGRQHPMGVLVTSRSMAWNYPAGNESLIYFIFELENVSASSEFQRLNEAQFFAGNNALPDAGITFNEVYAAFATDMDVGSVATDNYSTAILPFDIGLSYHGGFNIPAFEYSPDIFFAPFFTDAPGLIGVKYLKSPLNPTTNEEVGLTLFSATLRTGVGTLPDPGNDRQLWRYLSGTLNPSQGDIPCSVTAEVVSPDPAEAQRSVCFLTESSEDTRFFQASGPFTLAPSESAKIVVAYIAAATVATLPNGDPSGLEPNAAADDDPRNRPGIPSFHPGFPGSRGCATRTALGCTEFDPINPVKNIERGAGWVEYTGAPPETTLEGPQGKLSQFEITVVPGSLLGRSLIAQTIFDSKFLLGFAPEQPLFYLVPGNNAVTVIWEKSFTEDTTVLAEEAGDPFYQVTKDPASQLFNPSYRQFDVEGYRVWRGTNPGNLQLVRQFDYADTEFTDFNCETLGTDESFTLSGSDTTFLGFTGFAVGETCPVDFEKVSSIDNNLVFNNGGPGGPPGAGVVRLATGPALMVTPTTAIVDDGIGDAVPLTNSGVPLVYTDNDVTNNFTYFYAVSAFDVNTPSAGPHSLRSSRVTQNVVPRGDVPNIQNAELIAGGFGDDGVLLDFNAPLPRLDGADGTFAGPFPPANGLDLSFAPAVPRLLPTFARGVKIDSFVVGDNLAGTCLGGWSTVGETCWIMYTTVDTDGVLTQETINSYTPEWEGGFGASSFPGAVRIAEQVVTLVSAEIAFDQDALDAFGIPGGSGFAQAIATFDESIANSNFEGQSNRRGMRENEVIHHGGSRWFSGANETVVDPTRFVMVGELDGVTEVFAPIHHTPLTSGPNPETMAASGSAQCFGYAYAFLGRAADVQFTWNGGTVAVRDLTHHVPVLFKPTVQAAWGFLNSDGNGNGFIDFEDFDYITNVSANLDDTNGPLGFCGHTHDPATVVSLEETAVFGPVQTDHTVNPPLGAATGMGFGLLINGERFIFELDAIPADGTVWTLRTYNGFIRTDNATGESDNPNGYRYRLVSNVTGRIQADGFRSPAIPGLNISFKVEAATNLDGPVDLTRVHTVPDPYLGTSLYDLAPTSKQLMFVNLPEEATIRIYSLTGVLVDVIVHEDPTGGGRSVWSVRNRNQQFVASGVYFFHVVTPDGDEHVGKFTIINQAGSN